MASFKEDVKQGLRERIENNTGIVGSVLRDRREQREKQAQVDNEVAEIKKVTKKIKVGGTTLVSMEKSFTQISENLQLIAKVFKAQATTFEETQAAYKPQEKLATAQPKQQAVIQKLADEKEDVSILDRISNLIDNFEKKRKTRKQSPANEADRKAKQKAEAERKELDKNKEKTRAQAERAQQAAKEEARVAGKSAKQVEQAGRNAAKKVVKQASEAAIKTAAQKIALKTAAKFVIKSFPFVGTAVGLASLVVALFEGNYTGAAIEAVGALTGPVGGAASALASMEVEVYREIYGTDPTIDAIDDPAGAPERMALVHKICKETLLEALKENAVKRATFVARATKTNPKSLDKQQALNVLSSGESDEQLNRQFEGGRAALEQIAGIQPTKQITPPPTPGAKPTTEEQIKSVSKAKVSTMDMSQFQPTGGIVGTITQALKSAGIASEKAIGNILATIKAESNFRPRSEDLTYKTAEAIQKTFGKNRIPSLEFAQQFVNNPEALANEVYKKTDGNKEPGDGYKFRGRGFIQHTGRNQYEGIKKFTGVDVVSNPDLLNDPVLAAKAMVWFFLSYKNKKPEQLENISEVNKAIGFADDAAGTHAAQRAESATQITANLTAGNDLESLSTNVASAKKAQQAGSSVTVIAVNNNTQTKMGAANRPPQSQTTAIVGA